MLRKYILLVAATGLFGSGLYATFFPESWLYGREVAANRARAQEAAKAAKEAGLAVAEDRFACSSPGCCAVARFTPVTQASVPQSSAPPSSPSLVSRYVRFLRWFADHFLHSHHLMHLSVIFCTHFAFVWCAKWKFTKLALQQAANAAAITKAITP